MLEEAPLTGGRGGEEALSPPLIFRVQAELRVQARGHSSIHDQAEERITLL